MTDQTTDRHTCHNQKAAAGPAWQCSRCSATPAAPLSPVVQSPIREQLLNSIDATFCQSLGFGTPEGLLAAYEASRIQTVDQAAFRERVAAALKRAPFKELRTEGGSPNGPLEIAARVDDLADAALAAVLPATTNHDTDTNEHAAPVYRAASEDRRQRYATPLYAIMWQNGWDGERTERVVREMDLVLDAVTAVADAEINEHREHIAVYRKDSAAQYQIIAELQRENAELRRVADETAATSDVGAEFVQQTDQPDEAGLAAWERDLADETAATETQPADLPALAAALDGFATLLATSSRDWGVYRVDAWLYAVILGWDCEQTEHDDTCVHGALEEMAEQHGWDDATVAKARRYRAAVRTLVEAHQPAGARQDGAQP